MLAFDEGWALEEAEALPEALSDALAVELAVVLAVGEVGVALGVLLVLVTGAAARAAHSVSRTESVETMVRASPRLVAVIESFTRDCSLVGSPATVTVAEL